jgi:hypothetical protein
MTDYELTFIVDSLEESQIEQLLTNFDCVAGETHAGEEFVTVTAQGTNAVEAAKAMQTQLATFGVLVRRLEFDLVTRREIAERLSVEPQAVGLWVRGERSRNFPRAFHEVANGVWLWGDVVRWSRETRGLDPADGLSFPTREDHYEVNACFDRRYRDIPQGDDSHTFLFGVTLGRHPQAWGSLPKAGVDWKVYVAGGFPKGYVPEVQSVGVRHG